MLFHVIDGCRLLLFMYTGEAPESKQRIDINCSAVLSSSKSGSTGNSGVQVRSRYDYETSWLNGPQVDIHPAHGWRCGLIYDETRGVQHWIHPELPDWRIDQQYAVQGWSWDRKGWNTIRIRCRGTTIETEVNGVVISQYDGAGVLDDEFHKKYNVGMRGHIALQLHKGDDLRIAFRNVRLEQPGDTGDASRTMDSR